MKKIDRVARRLSVTACLLALLAVSVGACVHPLIHNWQAYRAAKKRGDYATAGKFLADDARIWFGKKEGDGHPLRARGGPYKDSDKEFQSTSTRRDVRVKGRTVTYLTQEINDYYRLLERVMGEARITYLLR